MEMMCTDLKQQNIVIETDRNNLRSELEKLKKESKKEFDDIVPVQAPVISTIIEQK